MFGLTMFEGAAVLGEAPVFTDGSWLANVPPYIPVHLQPIDKFGLAIRNQQLWIQGMPGRGSPLRRLPRVAHRPGRPGLRPEPDGRRAAGTASTTSPSPSPSRTRVPVGQEVVQPILDAKCESCHNASDDRRTTT